METENEQVEESFMLACRRPMGEWSVDWDVIVINYGGFAGMSNGI